MGTIFKIFFLESSIMLEDILSARLMNSCWPGRWITWIILDSHSAKDTLVKNPKDSCPYWP